MKANKIVVILLLEVFSIGAYAQSTALEKVMREVYDLKQDKEALTKRVEKLKLSLDSIKSANTVAEELKAKETRLKELKGFTNPQTLSTLEKSVKELKSEIENKSKEYTAQMNLRDGKANKLKTITDETSGMTDAQQRRLQRQFEDNRNYLQTSFAKMDDNKLKELENSLSTFTSMTGYSDYEKRVKHARSCYDVYQDGQSAIKTKFSKTKVDGVRGRLIPLIKDKNRLTTPQFNELDSLDICLSRFEGGVKFFQELIKEINEDTTVVRLRDPANFPQSKEARVEHGSQLRDAISIHYNPAQGTEKDKKIARYFEFVPYLNAQFRRFKYDLEKFPSKNSKVENEINELNK